MQMKIDKKNKQVFILPLCPDASPADQERFKEMLEFLRGKFKSKGYKVIEEAF